jgi:hypothetical protein
MYVCIKKELIAKSTVLVRKKSIVISLDVSCSVQVIGVFYIYVCYFLYSSLKMNERKDKKPLRHVACDRALSLKLSRNSIQQTKVNNLLTFECMHARLNNF